MKTKHGTKMKMLRRDSLNVLQFSGLSRFCNISHFITTRRGGVSKGNYASMNPGMYSGDDMHSVRMNLELLSKGVGISSGRIFYPHQVHGDRIGVLEPSFLLLSKEEQKGYMEGVDALVTDLPGVCVSVATADCVPVLLYGADKQVVAAVHAGWRGTVQQIVQQTVAVLVGRYGCDPSRLFAGIAPSIGPDAFEVGEEVVAAFRDSCADLSRISYRNSRTGKAHIDLWEANRLQLLDAGIPDAQIEVSRICTYTNCDEYFSARRLGIKSGRIVSGIQVKARL